MFYFSLVCVLCFQFISVSSEDPVKIPFTFTTPFKFSGSTIKYIQVADNQSVYLSGSQTYSTITVNVTSSLSLPWPHLPPLSLTKEIMMINDTDFAEKTKRVKEGLREVLEKFNKTSGVLLCYITWIGIFSVGQSNATVSLEVLLLTEGNSSFVLVKVGDLSKVKTIAGTNTFFKPRQVKLTTLTLFTPSVFESSNIGLGYEGSWLFQVDAHITGNSVLCSKKAQPHSSITLYNTSYIYYKCDKGWNTLMNNSKEYLKCNKGKWKENMNHDVICYEIICPKLKLDPAGTVGIDILKSPKRPIGAAQGSVKYHCSKNYYIEPEKAQNYCYKNGTWSTGPIGPKCHLDTLSECSSLPPTINNSILLSPPPYYVNTMAQYKCTENYSSTEDISVECLAHGVWDKAGFTCVSDNSGKSDKLFDDTVEMLIIAALSTVTFTSVLTVCFCLCGRKRRRNRRVILTHPILVQEARTGQVTTAECPKCPEHINKFCTQHQGTRISWVPVISSQKRKSLSYVNDSFEEDF